MKFLLITRIEGVSQKLEKSLKKKTDYMIILKITLLMMNYGINMYER
jgi:hypothetical protein